MKSLKVKQYGAVIALMLGSFTAGMSVYPLAVSAETGNFGVFLQVYDLLKQEYIEKNLDESKLVQGAIRGMLGTLSDPYTRYMDSQAFKGMQEERQGSFSGIGIQIGMKDKHLAVISPLEDTPAFKAGLKKGDFILEIDGKSTKDMSVDEAVSLIRGRVGTPVKLLIARPNSDKQLTFSITRANIETKVVKTRMIDAQIGYLRLASFMNNDAPGEIKKAINELKGKGMQALVLDLRGNPGGLLPNAVDIGSFFIPKGPVVQVVGRNGQKELLNASGQTLLPTSFPVAVLIDGGSASASEILAGALKDTHRATLIGTRSFGKGLVQTVHPLSDGSGVAITTNKYLTSGGTDINKKGIDPDILVNLPEDAFKEGDEEMTDAKDTQLTRALQHLKQALTAKGEKPKDKAQS